MPQLQTWLWCPHCSEAFTVLHLYGANQKVEVIALHFSKSLFTLGLVDASQNFDHDPHETCDNAAPLDAPLSMSNVRRWEVTLLKLASYHLQGTANAAMTSSFAICKGTLQVHLWSKARFSSTQPQPSCREMTIRSRMVHLNSAYPARQHHM